MGILDKLDLSDRKTQLLIGGGAIVGVFALRGILGGQSAEVTTDVGDGYGTRSDGEGVPGWVGNANPTAPAPTPAEPNAPNDTGQTLTPRPSPSPTTPSATAGAPQAAAAAAAMAQQSTKGRTTFENQATVAASVGDTLGFAGDVLKQTQATEAAKDLEGLGTAAADRIGAAAPASSELQRKDAPGKPPTKTPTGSKQAAPKTPTGSKQAPAKTSTGTPTVAKPATTATNVAAGTKGRSIAAAGEGTVIDDDHDVNPTEWGWLSGTVGGFDPNPAAVTASVVAEIRAGESLASLSARLFGTSGHGSKLVAMNPDVLAGDGLTAGDRLRVM